VWAFRPDTTEGQPLPVRLMHSLHTLRVTGAFGVVGWVLVHHREQAAFERGRRLRRALTVGGIVALLLLVFVGLGLVQRAVVRERSASRLRDAFVANVSHELRTPVASVLLHAEMLAEAEVPDAKRRRLARVVEAEATRLSTLVEDLLDFEALTAGRRVLEPEPMDLAALVRRAVAPYETLAEREGVALGVEGAGEEVMVLADPHAVGRILSNLLANAWLHGRPSRDGAPGRIGVRLRPAGLPGACVQVWDDGPGIPPAEREAVFERFRRGESAGSARGTGLGLALARDLARAMEGDLSLWASKGETVFVLRLPWEDEPREDGPGRRGRS